MLSLEELFCASGNFCQQFEPRPNQQVLNNMHNSLRQSEYGLA
jgi:hypothetical protein